MQLSILLAKTGGKVVFVGMGTPEAMLPTANAFCREIDLIGTYPTRLLLYDAFAQPGSALSLNYQSADR
jgi:L-iditol 2-dehydrogenase